MTSNDPTPTPKPDVRFAVTIDGDSSRYAGMTSYRHFTARAYVLGVDKYGSTGRPELLSPTDYNVPDSTVRNLAGLQITAQADSDSMRKRQPFLRRVPETQDYEGHGYRSMDADALSGWLWSDASDYRKDHGLGDES